MSRPTATHKQWLQFFQSLCPDSDPVTMRLMGELRVVAHNIYQRGETSLESAEISSAQFRILMGLLFSEEIEGRTGLNPSEISARQGTNRNTISALVRSLEKAKLVTRALDENDRRKFNICLTNSGRALVRDHANSHFQVVEETFGVLDEAEVAEFGRLLQKLSGSIGRR